MPSPRAAAAFEAGPGAVEGGLEGMKAAQQSPHSHPFTGHPASMALPGHFFRGVENTAFGDLVGRAA